MKVFLTSFIESFSLMRRDKVIILLSGIPVAIGLALYSLLSNYIYTDLMNFLKSKVVEQVSSGFFATAIYYVITALISVALFFFVNWTFVLIVSLVAGPFNDLIGQRVERLILKGTPEPISKNLKEMIKNIATIMINEIKKISLILFLSIIALALSLIPLLAPVSLVLSALLLAAGFIDYSWSRHDMKFSSCLANIKSNFFKYLFSGMIFLFLISIPILNLFVLPYAVIYFTLIFTKTTLAIKEEV